MRRVEGKRDGDNRSKAEKGRGRKKKNRDGIRGEGRAKKGREETMKKKRGEQVGR